MTDLSRGSPWVFICYRADDTLSVATALARELQRILEWGEVFLDHRSLEGGEPWPDRLRERVRQAEVVLVLIGARWLTLQTPDGIRRLDDPDDWVRQEIEGAIPSHRTLIPVLVDGALPLEKRALRTVRQIESLADRQALPLMTKLWEETFDALVQLLCAHGFRTRPATTATVMSISAHILRERLEGMSAIELQAQVIEPYLHANGFESVRDITQQGGPTRDLVASKSELGTRHLYAIHIITGFRSSADAAGRQALDSSLTRLCCLEEMFDPATLSRRTPDRLVLFTPFAISPDVLDDALTGSGSVLRNGLTIVDGSTLVSEVLRVIPEVAAGLNDSVGYRLRLTSEHDVIAESTSFGLASPLSLKEIFVEADYACFDNLERLLQDFLDVDLPRYREVPPGPRQECSPDELALLARAQSHWQSPNASSDDAHNYALEDFIRSLTSHATAVVERVTAFVPADSDHVLNEIHQGIGRLQRGVDLVAKTSILSKRSHLIAEGTAQAVRNAQEMLRQRRRLLTYRHLYRINSTIVITGPAGAGKTTLLRTIVAAASAEDVAREVAFARALDINDYSVDGVLRQLQTQMNRHGRDLSPDQLREMMSEGRIRVLIDGLDEAGDRAQQLALTILKLTEAFPRAPVAVTCRETVDLSGWHTAILLKLCPFSDSQLDDFISRWFAAKPSARARLIGWLNRVPAMKEIARTPLIAALLCSLSDVNDVEMPLSETDLYERRLEFLLGKWEQAKTIPPMPPRARMRYTLFLMHLAYGAHADQTRSITYSQALALTPKYMTPGFNSNGASVVRDCVGRGLLMAEPSGEYSLGHLSHQEFLTGKYLHRYNDPEQLISRLGVDWWIRPLLFYASLIGDISGLLQKLNGQQRREHHAQIRQLMSAAEETPRELL